MRVEFQRTLINNTNYDPLAPAPWNVVTFFQLNSEMLAANARIDVRHNWESTWWEWPLNLRGLLYYSQEMKHSYTKVRQLAGARCHHMGAAATHTHQPLLCAHRPCICWATRA